jgi:hypothetical protein
VSDGLPDVVRYGGPEDLDDVNEEPVLMERLYARENDGGRSFNSVEAVRCPVCGRVVEWRNRRKRSWCIHDEGQARFSAYSNRPR